MASGGGLYGGYGGAASFEYGAKDESVWSSNTWAGGSSFAAKQYSQEIPSSRDCEEYISALVKEIGRSSMPVECEGLAKPFRKRESVWTAQALSTSPQSTLAGLSWDLLSPGSSSNGGVSSGFSSPPTPVEASPAPMSSHIEKDTLDLLYAELIRLKVEDEVQARQQQLIQLRQQQHYQNLLWKIRQQHAAACVCEATEDYNVGKQRAQTHQNGSNNGLYYRSKVAGSGEPNQTRGGKRLEGAWSGAQAYKNSVAGGVSQASWGAGEVCSSSTEKSRGLYGHKQQSGSASGSGMRAVFLGAPGRESCGTGVFLPRRVGGAAGGNALDSRRKPACSTVLLPSRIVQALNLNVEDTLPRPAVSSANRRDINAPLQRSTTIASRAEPALSEWMPVTSNVPVSYSLQEVAPNISLPSEWTY